MATPNLRSRSQGQPPARTRDYISHGRTGVFSQVSAHHIHWQRRANTCLISSRSRFHRYNHFSYLHPFTRKKCTGIPSLTQVTLGPLQEPPRYAPQDAPRRSYIRRGAILCGLSILRIL
jgi:hypothetical protein